MAAQLAFGAWEEEAVGLSTVFIGGQTVGMPVQDLVALRRTADGRE